MIKHRIEIEACMQLEQLGLPEADLMYKITLDGKPLKVSEFDSVECSLDIGKIFKNVLKDIVVKTKIENPKQYKEQQNDNKN
jgi:hypothetical protein